jgi:uncharacterized membrane protein
MSFVGSVRRSRKTAKRKSTRKEWDTRLANPVSVSACVLIVLITCSVAALMQVWGVQDTWIAVLLCAGCLIALYLLFALKIAKQ